MPKFTSKLHIGKSKTDKTEKEGQLSQEQPPPYSTFVPSYTEPVQQPLPKQTSTDQKPKNVPVEYPSPAEPSFRQIRSMPGNSGSDYEEPEERRPRRRLKDAASESDLEEGGHSMQLTHHQSSAPRRSKSRKGGKSSGKKARHHDVSDSDDEDGSEEEAAHSEEESDRDYKKARQLTKRKKETAVANKPRSKPRSKSSKKSKHRKEESASSDSDEEIVIKSVQRWKKLTVDQLDPLFFKLLMDAFDVNENRIFKWCEKNWIKWDNSKDEYNIKLVIESENDAGSVSNYDKIYGRHKKEWQKPSDKERPESSAMGARPQRPTMMVEPMQLKDPYQQSSHYGYGRLMDGVGHAYNDCCFNCQDRGMYCGDPYHNDGY